MPSDWTPGLETSFLRCGNCMAAGIPSIANHEHYFSATYYNINSSKLPKYVDFITLVLCLHVCRQVLGLVAAASRKMSSISCTSVRLSTYHRLPTTGTR